ncbi:MAG: hypothetical protein AAF479_12705, partial [Pseudomonadota bacterium]
MSVSDGVTPRQSDQGNLWLLLGWLFVGLVPLAFYVTSQNYLERDQLLFLTLASGVVLLWVFRLVPDFVPGVSLVMLVVL